MEFESHADKLLSSLAKDPANDVIDTIETVYQTAREALKEGEDLILEASGNGYIFEVKSIRHLNCMVGFFGIGRDGSDTFILCHYSQAIILVRFVKREKDAPRREIG